MTTCSRSLSALVPCCLTLPSPYGTQVARWYEGHVWISRRRRAGSGGTSGVTSVKAARSGGSREDLGESLGYAIKRRLLGPPLVNEQLREERLSKPLALGVLAPDGVSS